MDLVKIENEELLLIDKPKGITSFDVIRILKKNFKENIKKIGHAGTLDPNATGLMLIGINKGTKKLNDYLKLDKIYIASILFGTSTDSFDVDGKILEEKEINIVDVELVKKMLNQLIGKINLQVPIYSAIKINGKRLYDVARSGNKENIIPPTKEMEVYYVKFLNLEKEDNKYVLNIELEVKSGTYIRSIVNELSKKLNMPMTLKELRRTKIGNFKIENSYNINNLMTY